MYIERKYRRAELIGCSLVITIAIVLLVPTSILSGLLAVFFVKYALIHELQRVNEYNVVIRSSQYADKYSSDRHYEAFLVSNKACSIY